MKSFHNYFIPEISWKTCSLEVASFNQETNQPHHWSGKNSSYSSPLSLVQDYFWTFCAKLWKEKDIPEASLLSEAHNAAKAYVDQNRAAGVLP